MEIKIAMLKKTALAIDSAFEDLDCFLTILLSWQIKQ